MSDGRLSHPAQGLGQETCPHSCTEQLKSPLFIEREGGGELVVEERFGAHGSSAIWVALPCRVLVASGFPAPLLCECQHQGAERQALLGVERMPWLTSQCQRRGAEVGGPSGWVPRQSLPSLKPHICPSRDQLQQKRKACGLCMTLELGASGPAQQPPSGQGCFSGASLGRSSLALELLSKIQRRRHSSAWSFSGGGQSGHIGVGAFPQGRIWGLLQILDSETKAEGGCMRGKGHPAQPCRLPFGSGSGPWPSPSGRLWRAAAPRGCLRAGPGREPSETALRGAGGASLACQGTGAGAAGLAAR
ncbi:hypothetical protein E2320_006746 [Naja naja]|nr:hypothetical protein E2320_006746 [Naja naja]